MKKMLIMLLFLNKSYASFIEPKLQSLVDDFKQEFRENNLYSLENTIIRFSYENEPEIVGSCIKDKENNVVIISKSFYNKVPNYLKLQLVYQVLGNCLFRYNIYEIEDKINNSYLNNSRKMVIFPIGKK